MLSQQDIASLRSLPRSAYTDWLNDIAAENPALADECERLVGRSRESASKTEVADFFAISLETVDLWARKGMPYEPGDRKAPNRYSVRQVAQWLAAQRTIKVGDDAEAGFRDEKRRVVELQRLQLEGKLVDYKHLQSSLSLAIECVRKGVESIQRSFGDEAADAIGKVIDEAEAIVLSGNREQADDLDEA